MINLHITCKNKRLPLFTGNLQFIIYMFNIIVFYLSIDLIYFCQKNFVQNESAVLRIYQTIAMGLTNNSFTHSFPLLSLASPPLRHYVLLLFSMKNLKQSHEDGADDLRYFKNVNTHIFPSSYCTVGLSHKLSLRQTTLFIWIEHINTHLKLQVQVPVTYSKPMEGWQGQK